MSSVSSGSFSWCSLSHLISFNSCLYFRSMNRFWWAIWGKLSDTRRYILYLIKDSHWCKEWCKLNIYTYKHIFIWNILSWVLYGKEKNTAHFPPYSFNIQKHAGSLARHPRCWTAMYDATLSISSTEAHSNVSTDMRLRMTPGRHVSTALSKKWFSGRE